MFQSAEIPRAGPGLQRAGVLTPEGGAGTAESRGAYPGGRGRDCRGQECSPLRAGPGAAEGRSTHPRGQGRGLQGGCELTLEGGAGGCRGQE